MINGAHVIILSKQPEADRAFFRDVLGLTNVDVGGGWLIFALPPSEVAVHPSDRDSVHEFYLMCEDVNALTKTLTARGIACGPIEDQGWGLLTSITLPGGGSLGAYQPRHARPVAAALSPASGGPAAAKKKVTAKKRPAGKPAAKKAVPKTARKTPAKKAVPKKVAPKKAAKRGAGRKRR